MRAGSAAEAEFRAFAHARSAALLCTATLLAGDRHHAEDLVQLTLMRLYVAWPRIRDKSAAEAYARRTLVTTYTSWRRRKWWSETPDGELGDRGASPVPALDDQVADRDQLWRALRELPRQQRAVVVLRYIEDASVAEVARLLGVSTGSVKTHTSRALAAMRIRLDASDGSADDHVAPNPLTGESGR